ncbi:MAG: PAS domain S-box protein [Flavobacteriaceae bacterium]|nr:PAS domain S-box protein [Flavobacteriaceae bacterium]
MAYSSPKKGLVIAVGFFLIGLLFIFTLARYHVQTEHKLKIASLEQIRLALVYAHLEKEDPTLTILQAKHLFLTNTVSLLNTLLEKKWDDPLLLLISKEERGRIKNLIKQIAHFKVLLKEKKSPEAKATHDVVFNSIINNINTLDARLKKRATHQNSVFYIFQVVLIIIAIAWLVFTIITLRYVKVDRKKLQSVQKDLLEKLKRNNYFLEKAQDISNLGYYTFNLSTREWTASDFILDLVGYKKGNNILGDWKKIVHPDDGDVLPKIFYDNTVTGDFSFDLTYRVIRKQDGKTRWIHHVASKLEGVDNQSDIAVIGVIQDVTKRKNDEEILEQSHQRFKSLFDENPIGIWEDDYSEVIQLLNDKKQEVPNLKAYLDSHPDFVLRCAFKDTILNVNASLLDLFEVADKKEFGQHLKAHFNEEHLKLYKKGLLAIALNKRSLESEIDFVTKTGKTINTILKVVMVGDKGKALFTINNITERKLAEQALIESHKKLEEAQNITGLGTFIFYDNTSTFETSTLLNNIAGIDKSFKRDVEGWKTLAHPDDYGQMKHFFDESELVNISHEFRVIRPKDKKIIWVLAHLKKVFDNKGNRKKITGTIQDITQRKQAEENLKQSDAILSRLNSMVLVNDGHSNIIYVSPSVKQVLGYEPEELLGQGWWNKTYETAAEAKKVQEAVTNYLYQSGPKTERVTYRKIKTKAGGFRHIEWHISKGVGKTYINIGVDITQRYREEQIKKIIFDISKYAHSNPKIEDLLPFVKDSLSTFIDTSNFYVALCNPEKQTFSLPYVAGEDADLQGKSFPYGKSLTAYVLRKKKTTVLRHTEFEDLDKSGEAKLLGKPSKIWVGVPLIEANKAIGVMTVQSYTDTDAFKKEDIALLEHIATYISQVIKQAQDYEKIQLLNQSMIQSPAAIVITDRAGCIEYVNPTFSKLSGYSYKEAIGQNPRILKSGDQEDAYYKNLWDTITMGKIWRGEFVNKSLDNRKYLVSATISPVKDSSGEITHFIGVQEDITEKRQLERDYLNAFIEAQEEEKAHFGEELHDGISQILAAEAMYIEILIKQNKDRLKDKAQYLLKVRELNLSAIEDARNISHGLMSKQLKEKGMIKAIAQICNDFSKSKNINFKFTCKNLLEKDIAKEIKTNLFRVTQEISTNIVRHSLAKKASVSFEKTADNNLILLIEDDGVGIDFEKIKKEKKGAGLKNIERRITLLNGKLAIESVLEKGTKFIITVPLATSI